MFSSGELRALSSGSITGMIPRGNERVLPGDSYLSVAFT